MTQVSAAERRDNGIWCEALWMLMAAAVVYAIIDETTGCFRCGAPGGSAVSLCPTCIAEMIAKVPWM